MSQGPPGASPLEKLRRDLANHGSPDRSEKALRCRQGHPLIWLIRTQGGIAPIANRAGKGSFGMRMANGGLMTLDQWPAGELLPTASCACHDEVQVSLHQARTWLEVPRDKFVYEP